MNDCEGILSTFLFGNAPHFVFVIYVTMNGPVGTSEDPLRIHFEPEASPVQGERYTRLSYGPININGMDEIFVLKSIKIIGGDPAAGSPTATL